jgi:predicted dehydrogenase
MLWAGVLVTLSVAIVGCGLMGWKRAAAIGGDRVVACVDRDHARAVSLSEAHGARPFNDIEAALRLAPDVVVVATTHDVLADLAIAALESGSHVLVEKPAGRAPDDVDRIAAAAARAGRVVKVGFNHRFHPAISRAVAEARSGAHGDVMYVRGRYGHGGRPGYDREWRADPRISGGGELLDQGMHLLDLLHWTLGPLPLHSALLRTSFWDMSVEDNAALLLGAPGDRHGPWASLTVSWSEWKNEFVFEIYCRSAKLQVTGLGGSYGPETMRLWRMRPEMGPPDLVEAVSDGPDTSWAAEWANLRSVIDIGDPDALLGDLESARYGLEIVISSYALAGWTVAT